MKKIFLTLLIAAMLLSGTALADSRAAELDGRLFLSLGELRAVDASGVETLDKRETKHLQAANGCIYYVAVEPGSDEMHYETLICMDANGNTTIIGEARLCGETFSYADNYSQLTDYCWFPGYGHMTVYGDYIYFIGANGIPGSYFTTANDWGSLSGEYETRYESTSSLYRMDLDGSNLVELVPGLGNGQAHLDIANDTIALSSCWRNAVYAYDFSDFMLCDLDGNLIEELPNTAEDRHCWIYKEDCEFTCIVTDIQTDGETIYASLGDSEGDFASARLTDMHVPDETLFYEAFYTPSVIREDGIAVFTSDAPDSFWDECMRTSLSLRWIDGSSSRELTAIPFDFANYGDMYLDRVGDMLYLTNGRGAIRVSIHGGQAETLGADGFGAASFYLLPESDTRLYGEDELEVYDTETLGYMRNEILARHGYVFKKAHYRDYFSAQSWYQENPDFQYGLLNDIEMANVETIKALEAQK